MLICSQGVCKGDQHDQSGIFCKQNSKVSLAPICGLESPAGENKEQVGLMNSNITGRLALFPWGNPRLTSVGIPYPSLVLGDLSKILELGAMRLLLLLSTFFFGGFSTVSAQCPDYSDYSMTTHEPFSAGKYQLSYQRPTAACRTANVSDVEKIIQDMKAVVKDPDLFRLFENTFPNTLDTTVKWKGYAEDDSTEEVY